MIRVVVSGMPAVDLPGDAEIVIGSAASANVRLPRVVEDVRIAGLRWTRGADGGEVGDGVDLAIGDYRVYVAPSPAGAVATPAVRTESLARELVRHLMGDGGAPMLEVERGPVVGAKRALAPPESSLVIGRGDEATWVIFDGDLSRAHADVQRGWDGVRVFDRGSKNGTRVDGIAVGESGAPLLDGARIELGNVIMRFADPAERHLRGEPSASTSLPAAGLFPSSGFSVIEPRPVIAAPAVGAVAAKPAVAVKPRAAAPPQKSQLVFYVALAIAALATSALVYVLAS